MKKFYILLIPILLCSCFTPIRLNYLGNSFSPTKNIDVYVDASAIRKMYTIMGKSFIETNGFKSLEKIQQMAVEKAKQKGAHAVLFRDFFIQEGGSFHTVSTSDSISSSSVRIRTTAAAPVGATRLDILFLRYD